MREKDDKVVEDETPDLELISLKVWFTNVSCEVNILYVNVGFCSFIIPAHFVVSGNYNTDISRNLVSRGFSAR